MIRLIQRRLIIPRGDTGTFTVPALSPGQSDSVGVFTIFDPITKTRVFQKQVELQDGVFNIEFDHGDTVNLQAGDYLWDIKFYVNPIIENGKVIDGTEIDSYYAAFQTPKCEIRETGDDFMVIDGQPAKIEDLNIILAATSAANAAKVAATEQAEIAATKASEAAERLEQMIAAIPTKVSELENDSGYLQEETDPTVPAWAKAQTKPSYTPQEVGALPSDTFIPSKVSDLTDDSGHYIKPANGIPASDLEETYLTQHQDISMKANSADLAAVATSGDYSDLANTPYIPTKTSDLVNDSSYPVDANYIHTDNNYTTAEKEKLAGIAAGAKVNVNADWNAISGDAQILNKPTNVSAFTNDAGYLTEHQDISGKADKSEIPTQVSELENDAGYLTSFTETDPTVPAWAKEPNKPAYTAAEINAVNKTGDTMTGALTLPYISQSYRNALRFGTNSNTLEMGINARYDQNYDYGYFTVSSERTSGFTQDAIIRGVKNPRYSNDAANKEYVDNKISTAIGNINSFDMAVVQELPTQDISTHTIYLVPKTGETNDVYDEYVYINDAWEMVGNTQIDLSDYALKSEIPTKVSELNNDSGYLTSYTETDPTVPQWAKASTKPSYTAVEVGALPSDTHIPSTTAELTNDAGFITSSALPTKVSDLTNDAGYLTTHQDISGKANAADLATVATSGSYNDLSNKPTIPEVPVQDVQVNGTSVLTNGVANIPGASTNNFGVIRVNSLKGTTIDNMGDLVINGANENYIKQARTYGEVINPANQHWATFYGLARIAGDTTQSNSTNSSGTYTPEAKGAIQSMLGVSDLIATEENNLIASKAYKVGDVFTANGKLYKATAAIAVDGAIITDGANANCVETSVGEGFPHDVQVNGISVLENGVANIPKATSTTLGAVKIDGNGLVVSSAGQVNLTPANDSQTKLGGSAWLPLVPLHQHESTFYGLAKAAGADEKDSTLPVGQYTDTAKTAIRTMLGATSNNVIAVQDTQPTDTDTKIWLPETAPEGVEVPTMADMNAALAGKVGDVQVDGQSVVSNGIAEIPKIGTNRFGVAQVNGAYGVGATQANYLYIVPATDVLIKTGTDAFKPIVSSNEHQAAFYGLAKAAGDTTQSASDNAVGTYTDEAKAAIKNMLGITHTLTVTVLTQDSVTVTGQTVTVRADDASGGVYATAAYEGQPVSFSVPDGFQYYVSVSDTLAHHFNPTTASGIITNTDVSVTLQYSDFSTIRSARDIKAALNAGLDLTDLVGEQITCTKNNETLTWDVADYDATNGRVTLLLHDAFGTANMVFEPAQALMWCENGLAAGSYTFTWNTTQCYFTLATAIPAGGQLRATNSQFQTYASQDTTAALETGTVSTEEITGATDLGQTGQGLLNHHDRVNYGSNNQAESAIQWWLNSDAPANTLRTPVTKFSRAFSYAQPGFMNGLDSDFLDCLDIVDWLCSTNNVYECPETLGGLTKGTRQTYTIKSKFCFASEMEIFGSYGGNADGSTVFDLYNGADADDRKKYRGTSAQVWCLRSPVWSIAHSERGVYSSGSASVSDAYNSYAVVPACQISRDEEDET